MKTKTSPSMMLARRPKMLPKSEKVRKMAITREPSV